MATIGLPKSSSPMPVARQSERAPAALRPWVVTRERRAGIGSLSSRVGQPATADGGQLGKIAEGHGRQR
jgi:hypothetical protein